MSKLLVWCAGDVSEYQVITYVIRNNDQEFRVKCFLSPAALYKYVQPDKMLVFIPEILFCEDHEKQYITLIKAKYGFTENNKQYELLKEDLREKKLKKVTIDRKSEEIDNLDDFIHDLEQKHIL